MRVLITFVVGIALAVAVAALFVWEGWPYEKAAPLVVAVLALASLAYHRIPRTDAAVVSGVVSGVAVRNGPTVWTWPLLQSIKCTYPRGLQTAAVEVEATTRGLMPIKVYGVVTYRLRLDDMQYVRAAGGWTAGMWQSEVKNKFNTSVWNYLARHPMHQPFYACNREDVRRDLKAYLETTLQDRGVRDVTLRLDEFGPPPSWREQMLERKRQIAFLKVIEKRLDTLKPSLPPNSQNANEQTIELARLLVALRAAETNGQTSMTDLVVAGLFPQNHMNGTVNGQTVYTPPASGRRAAP